MRGGSVMLLLTLMLSAAVANAGLISLSSDDKQVLLDAHNKYRCKTANGDTAGQPSADNMVLVEWDDRLAASAANWARQCVAGHDKGSDRALQGYSWVGQNWAGGYSSDLTTYVKMWYDEYTDYTLASKSCSGVCGHYTQVVWAKTHYVGCAVSECSNYPKTIVCNYATGGNYNNEFPYEAGTPGSKCEGEFTYVSNGVCLSKDECNDASCTCSLSDSSCQNGGSLDSQNCKCKCADGFYGTRCQKKCKDADGGWDSYCPSINTPENCAGVYGQYCTKSCDLCRGTGPDPNAQNADNIVARCPA